MNKLILSLGLLFLVCLTSCAKNNNPPNCAKDNKPPKKTLGFNISHGVFAETELGSTFGMKGLRIQSKNDLPITILAISWNRGKETNEIYNNGYKMCPWIMKFGETFYVTYSTGFDEPIIEVFIRTDQGDFVSGDIRR